MCCLLPRLHSAPIPGSNPGGGSDPSCGGFHWPAFTQWSHSRSRLRNWGRTNELKKEIFLATHGKVPYIAGADPAFCLHTQKKQCQTPHAGSNPTNLEEQKRRVRPRNRGRWFCVYTEGQKAGLTPHLGFDPAIGALCKRGIWEHLIWVTCVHAWYRIFW